MELEAWYLCFIKTLNKIGLKQNYIDKLIESEYKSSLNLLDPEKTFYRPKTVLKQIYEKIKNKSYDEVKFSYQISKSIDLADISNICSTNKLSYFRKFYNFLKSFKPACYYQAEIRN